MTREGSGRADGGTEAGQRVPPGGRILVLASSPPPVAVRSVDVRPAASATFDGERHRLTLWVADSRRREPVPWSDGGALATAVGRALDHDDAAAVRFGGRSACRAALGTTAAEAVERRLAAVARSRGAGLLTWTAAAPREGDYRRYDAVVEASG